MGGGLIDLTLNLFTQWVEWSTQPLESVPYCDLMTNIPTNPSESVIQYTNICNEVYYMLLSAKINPTNFPKHTQHTNTST